MGQGGVFFFIFLSFQKKVRAWAEKKGATDFAAVGELAKMIRLDLKQYLVCRDEETKYFDGQAHAGDPT